MTSLPTGGTRLEQITLAPALSQSRKAVLTSSSRQFCYHPLGQVLPSVRRETSQFGGRFDPIDGTWHQHTGVDMAAPLGSLVLAAANGVVLSAGWARGYGNAVVISHGHGLTTRYAHLERGLVHSGETIELGQPIGQVGATGHATGNHLHFEIRVGNKALDPARPDLSFCDIASGTERPMAERLKEVAARPIWTNPAADDKLPTNLLN